MNFSLYCCLPIELTGGKKELLEELPISCFSKPARVHFVLSGEPVTDGIAEILAYTG